MGNVKEILQLVTNGGAIVVLVLVGYGLYRMAADIVPTVKEFLSSLVATQREMLGRLAAMDAKIDASARALDKLEVSAAGGFDDVREDIRHTERSIVAAVRREQASDPPPRSSAAPPVPPSRWQ